MLISLGGGFSFHLGGTKKKTTLIIFLDPLHISWFIGGSKEDEALNWYLMYEMGVCDDFKVIGETPVYCVTS